MRPIDLATATLEACAAIDETARDTVRDVLRAAVRALSDEGFHVVMRMGTTGSGDKLFDYERARAELERQLCDGGVA